VPPVRVSVAVVRGGRLDNVEGDTGRMPSASLVKLIIGHLALELVDDLDQPIAGDISTRHVLSHTTGLPNWREGEELVPIRPPGTRWGYSGEGFVLLQHELERQTGLSIDALAAQRVFGLLGMDDTAFDEPEPGLHGYRQLLTTAGDLGRFLAQVLSIDDDRWRPQWVIDDELAWGAGWGLELGSVVFGWQWGLNDAASNFVIGCPATGDGVVVLTDDPDGRRRYREIVERVLPGDHPSLRVERNPTWLDLVS
jgi:CubicO group peptidase (beta-lactamase class C family)